MGPAIDAPPAVRRPRVWTVLVAYLFAGVLQVATGLAAWAAAAAVLAARHTLAGGPVPPVRALLPDVQRMMESAWGLSASSLAFALALGGFALLLGALSPMPWRRRLRLEPSRLGPDGLALAVGGFLALSIASDSVIRLLGLQGRGTIGRLVFAFERASPGALALGVLSVGLVAGMAEELFFRGFVQSRLAERWGRWTAVALTAVGFGAYHFDALQGGFAVVIGLWLGWLADQAGSIRPAAAAHVVNNAAWVLGTALLPRPTARLDAGLLVLSVGIALAATLLLRRKLAARPASGAGGGLGPG